MASKITKRNRSFLSKISSIECKNNDLEIKLLMMGIAEESWKHIEMKLWFDGRKKLSEPPDKKVFELCKLFSVTYGSVLNMYTNVISKVNWRP